MNVYRISAITLIVKDMAKSGALFSKITGFRLTCGVKLYDRFSLFEIMKANNATYFNIELIEADEGGSANYMNPNIGKTRDNENFGRIIFHTDNVDKLYSYMEYDEYVSKSVMFENEPTNAPWGERFFHIREPNGYQLSFAQPL